MDDTKIRTDKQKKYNGRFGYIDADYAMDFANNLTKKAITANDIARFPRAKVKPERAGMWVLETSEHGYWYECSECGRHWPLNAQTHICEKTKHCPDCGVRLYE